MKYLSLNAPLYQYVCACRSNAVDPILDQLRRETQALGDPSRMQISRDQGSLLTLLTAAIAARSALEIGTFTGYSSICLARGLAENGRLICIDRDPNWTAIAQRYWTKAGVADRIQLRLGDGLDLLKALEPELRFDLVFIDANKTGYDAYYELVLPRVRPNGLILFDNMLWGGRLGGPPVSDPDGAAIDALNQKLAKDTRVETVLLSIADGIQLCRKR